MQNTNYQYKLKNIYPLNIQSQLPIKIVKEARLYNMKVGVYRLGVSAPILSMLPIIDIGHFKNRFADNIFFFFFFLCKQTYYLQVTLFIGE